MNKEPIRILHVLTRMSRAGAETMLMNYYRNIDRSKVQFDFLVHRTDKGDYDEEIKKLGGRIFKFEPINYFKLNSYKKKLSSFFKENHYDIVHSHLNATSTIILKIAQENDIPVRIAHSHTNLTDVVFKNVISRKSCLSDFFKKLFKDFLKKDINKKANYYFACEKKAGIWLFGKKNINKVQIINNAIDANFFKYNSKISSQLKNKFKIKDKFVIGHIGNFSLAKNPFFLLDIFNEIQKKYSNSTLVLVGSGELESKIKDKAQTYQIENKIMFLGVRADIPDLLQMMDIFLMPSLYEGLPVTLVEAQASGLKCFVSDVIDSNIDITGLINFIILNRSAKYWANYIIENKDYLRKDTYDLIKKNKYDIKENAKWLENFYLNKIKKL